MLAQIEGLNTCSPTSTDWPLEEGTGSGEATLELQENCETAFNVKIWNEPEGLYDLYMDGVYGDGPVATFNFIITDDGSGTVTGFVRFDPTPNTDAGELPLNFAVGIGSLVEVFTAGADLSDPNVAPVLSGMLVD